MQHSTFQKFSNELDMPSLFEFKLMQFIVFYLLIGSQILTAQVFIEVRLYIDSKLKENIESCKILIGGQHPASISNFVSAVYAHM